MAVSYEKISYDKIEKGLKDKINVDFANVYVSPIFKMIGNECVRVNLTQSELVEQHRNFSEREYNVTVRYYTKADMSNEHTNKGVKRRIDMLHKLLLDNQYNTTGTDGANNKWLSLMIDTISYGIEDNEQDENQQLYIAEFLLTLTNTNQF